MGKPGDVLDNPVTGEQFVLRTTTAETNGTLFVMDVTMQPGGFVLGKDAHIHPQQEERFTILEGALTVELNGEQRVYTTGEEVIIPPGTPHAAANPSASIARFRVEVRPALHAEQTFETFMGLARDGKVDSKGVPKNPLQLAVIFAAAPNETIPAQPVPPMQQRLLPMLAVIGKLFGYRAAYAKYGSDV